MTELTHTKKDCTANDLCLGGIDGLFCGNCGAGMRTEHAQAVTDEEMAQEVALDQEKCDHHEWDEYFDRCPDCGVTLEQLPQAMQDAYNKSLED